MGKKKISLKSDKLNVGSGTNILRGYLNLDHYNFPGTDVVWDINRFPWPFPDDHFSEILLSHIIEHVDDVVSTMSEVWRVSKDGAIINVEVPYFSSLNMVKDPTHKHFFSSATFDFFERGKLGKANYFEESFKINFKIIQRKIIYSNNKFLKKFNCFFNINQKCYERFFAYIFPAQTLEVTMRAIK